MASTQLSAHLPADAKALAELRRRVNELLVSAGIAESNRRDALLVANELAANAIEHGSRATDEIEIQCSLDGRHLRLAVLDEARSPTIATAYAPRAERVRGRGLQVVDRLTDSWSETIIGGRRRITARLTLQFDD